MIGAVSYTADYDCVCSYPLSTGGTVDSTLATYAGVKKDDAETSCASVQATINIFESDVTCAANKK